MAVPGGTSAQTDLMAEAAVHVDNAGQTLAEIRGRIQQAVAATSGGYQSDAASLFRGVMDAWNSDFNTILGGLERIHQALTQTQRHYVATAEQDQQSVNKIASLLNGNAGNVI